ncbi:MAG: site-specific DNA-methyltransferase [Paludibacter sp.]|nr:site-specific DNA-methyltransferase [Paludibacter sp.]
MQNIPDKSVNVILADLPYAQTRNSWDIMIPIESLWKEYKRIITDNGIIILFGQGIFSAKLIMSNPRMYRYTIIWEKTTQTGHLNAKKMPLRSHEDILIFYNKLPTYNPQKTTGHVRKVSTAAHKQNCKKTETYGEHGLTSYDSTERYPKSVWKFATDKQKSALHSTQKPLKLIEELIKTYSNEGDMVLDNTMGSGTTGEACVNLNRNFIGIELDSTIFNTAFKRIHEAQRMAS